MQHGSDISAVKGFVLGFLYCAVFIHAHTCPSSPQREGVNKGGGGHAVNNKRPNQFLLIPVLFQRVEVVVGGGRLALTNPPPSPPHLKGETCRVPEQLSCLLSFWRCAAAIEAASCARNGDRASKQIEIRRGFMDRDGGRGVVAWGWWGGWAAAATAGCGSTEDTWTIKCAVRRVNSV